jgi:hypothetical protein
MPLSEGATADPTGRTLELAGSAILATARRRTALAAVARPAAEVAGLLLVEVLGSPRRGRPRSAWHDRLAGWLAGRRPPARLVLGDHSAGHGGAAR